MLLFYLLFFMVFSSLVLSEQPLLKMGDNSECIKNVIDVFIKRQTCQKLTESQKSHLAIKMTNCLNFKLGKKLIEDCTDFKKCQINGDDWNTFTTFFTHIDNLCHFYWDVLHHERTETLIGGLSQSAFIAQDILNKNYQSTEKILQTHQTINKFMSQSLSSNKKLTESLESSQLKIQNMTKHIEDFLNELNINILTQYSTIVSVMSTINQGIEGMNTVQVVMMSEINSIAGILYFLLQILVIIIVTSFRLFKKGRASQLVLFVLNILVELVVPGFVLLIVGTRMIRILFVFGHVLCLLKAFGRKDDSFEQMKSYMDVRLDTVRIKRIFKEILEQDKRLAIPDEQLKQD